MANISGIKRDLARLGMDNPVVALIHRYPDEVSLRELDEIGNILVKFGFRV